MYCSQCGEKVAGNFCSACGARLAGTVAPAAAPAAAALPARWEDEVRYDVLLQYPQVRERIARYAGQARKPISSAEYLQMCDQLFAPLVGGLPVAKVAAIAQPLLARAGIKTGKTRQQVVPRPVGEALVAALCSLARQGQALKQVHQAEDGCVLEAAIPSDFWSLEGELILTVQRNPHGAHVEAATKILGQLYDWGKSTRCLNHLFDDVAALAN